MEIVDGQSVNKKMQETSITKKTSAKKASPKVDKPNIINRTCKILDVYVVEHVPPGSSEYSQYINMVLKDIYNKEDAPITVTITKEDLAELGYEFTTKSMIDFCSWLKTYDGVVKFDIDETKNSFGLKWLISQGGAFVSNPAESEEDETVELDSKSSTSEFKVKAVKKFGRKR